MHDQVKANAFNRTQWLYTGQKLIATLSFIHGKMYLHNDLHANNIVFRPNWDPPCPVIIDFGKATTIADPKRYNLTTEKGAEHLRKYPHLAPELLKSCSPPTFTSTKTDIFSLGFIFYRISKHCESVYKEFREVWGRMGVPNPEKRASLTEGMCLVTSFLQQ